MGLAKVIVNIAPRIRNRWAMRLGFWLLGLATVDIEADGKKLGSKRIVDILTIEKSDE